LDCPKLLAFRLLGGGISSPVAGRVAKCCRAGNVAAKWNQVRLKHVRCKTDYGILHHAMTIAIDFSIKRSEKLTVEKPWARADLSARLSRR